MYVCLNVWMYVCMYACMHLYLYVCVYVCVHVGCMCVFVLILSALHAPRASVMRSNAVT